MVNGISEMEERARLFALEKHGEQRYGEHPYAVHLIQVRRVLADFDYGDDLGVAAWLHDVIEDAGVSQEELAARFSAPVAALVWAVTGEGKNRKQRCASAYQKIRALPPAATLKLADRIANVESAAASSPAKFAMYHAEWPSFSFALSGLGDPRLWARLRSALSSL